MILDAYGRPFTSPARLGGAVGVKPGSMAHAPRITLTAPPARVTLAMTDVITVHMTACPNKPDTQSYTLYHCYRDNMTVADFIAAAAEYGITAAKARAHIIWDLKRDRIALNAA